MRHLLLVILVLFFASPVQAECPEGEAALHFIRTYLKVDADGQQRALPAVNARNWEGLVTGAFMMALDDLIAEAERENPEMGLGFDPVLDAQDAPDHFVVDSCEDGFVVLRGVGDGWEDSFTVPVKVIAAPGGGWLVDGSGVIRIPEELQRRE